MNTMKHSTHQLY